MIIITKIWREGGQMCLRSLYVGVVKYFWNNKIIYTSVCCLRLLPDLKG